MRMSFRLFAPVGLLVMALGVPSVHSANSPIDPDPRAPSLGELLAREEAARAKVERVAEPAAPMTPVEAVAKAAPAPMAPRGSVRQVHPAFIQPAVTVLVPGGKLNR